MAKRDKNKPQSTLTRQQSLDARPVVAPIHDRETLESGGERLTIEVPTPPWRQRILRMPAKVDRKFEFDAFGIDVIEMCDGQKPVKHIIDRFIRDHNLDPHEAERAVTTFLRTLIRRGIVNLYLPKHKA